MRTSEQARDQAARWGTLITVGLILALVGYKAMTATARLSAGKLPTTLSGGALHATFVYLKTIWPALLFGILIAAALRTLLPASLLTRLFARGPLRAHLAASAAATPLMLCSCCAAPLFVSVYERTRRAGPALALLIGAPSLNLAALVFTFMVLGPRLGIARIVMALIGVIVGTLVVARIVGDGTFAEAALAVDAVEEPHTTAGGFVRSLGHVAIRTLPFIVLGVFLSAAFAARVPPTALAANFSPLLAIVLVAALAVPLALPTFFELPLVLTLLGVGLPTGVAAAVLFAGPAINLPSLFTVARASSWRVAVAIAVAVWIIAVGGGVAVHLSGA